jgi:hypothetical protein
MGGGSQKEWWFSDAKCIMNEQRLSRYRVMRK